MKKRFLCMLFVLAMISSFFLSGCKKENGGSGETGEKIKGEWALPELKDLKGNKAVMLVANGDRLDDAYTTLLKQEYGLEIEYNEVAWDERSTKLSAMIVAGSSPDIYGDRAELNMISSNLIQPIDPYVDLTHKYYDKFRSYYDTQEWNGKHYGLYNSIMAVNTVYYNKKMFNDAGVETPWDQYQQGGWDWDDFAQAAEELTTTSSNGETEVYGFCFNRPVCWPYITGEAFAYVNKDTMTIESNMNSQKIARSMNFIYDLINVKKVGYKDPDTIQLFADGKAAMMPQDSAVMYSYFEDMIKEDNLGVAPMPRVPDSENYYARDMVGAFTIPVGAKNPQAAVALNACILYHQFYREGALDIKYNEIKEKYGMSDELVNQIRVCHGESNETVDNVKGVQEYIELLGYNCTWETIYWSIPWATALENRKAEMDSLISAALEEVEYDPPSGPKVIEGFEKIPEGGITTPITTKLMAIVEGSKEYELYLDAKDKIEGNYSGKMYYDFSDKGWGGFRRNVNKTWDTNNAMTFWLKGDGTKQKLTLSFVDGSETEWHYDLTFSGTEGKVYTIPFAEFKLPDILAGESIDMNLGTIKSFSVILSGEGEYAGEHSFNIDDIRAIFSE